MPHMHHAVMIHACRMQLVDLFGSVRDAWIADDLHGWLDANGIYAGLPDDLAAAQKQAELYIVTTKQVTFARCILRQATYTWKISFNFCKQIYIGTQMLDGRCQKQPTPVVSGVLCGVYALHVCSEQAKQHKPFLNWANAGQTSQSRVCNCANGLQAVRGKHQDSWNVCCRLDSQKL